MENKSRERRKEIRILHNAVKENDVSLVEGCLAKGTDPDLVYAGKTSLQIAVLNGYERICDILIRCGSNISVCNDEGLSLVHLALLKGHYGIMKTLLNKGADPNIKSNQGITPLLHAVAVNATGAVKVLVEYGCVLDIQNDQGQNALFVAVDENLQDMVTILIEAGADINETDQENRTALIVAAERGYCDIANILIVAGCNINHQMKFGFTATYNAAKNGHANVVELLTNVKANINLSGTNGYSPVNIAVENGHIEVVKLLVNSGCDLNHSESNAGQAPIHTAIRAEMHSHQLVNENMVDYLINCQSCDLNLPDKQGWSPLCHAAFSGHTEICKMLLQRNVDVTIRTQWNDTCLHLAMYGNKLAIVDMLIDAGADIDALNKKKETALYIAANNHKTAEIVKFLLDAGCDPNSQENESLQTPLIAALIKDSSHIAKCIINSGCDVNLQTRDGCSPLSIACKKKNVVIVKMLLSHPDIELEAGYSSFPLHSAAQLGCTDIVEMLLQAGSNVNKLTSDCVSALQLAVSSNSISTIKILLAWGANPRAQNHVKLPQNCCFQYSDQHPHLELDPLYSAWTNDNFVAMKLLLLASPVMPYRSLTLIRDTIFQTRYIQESRMSPELVRKYKVFFHLVLSRPRRLQDDCIGLIREALGHRLHNSVQNLPVPTKMLDCILLKSSLC